jgi:hypothetical protein
MVKLLMIKGYENLFTKKQKNIRLQVAKNTKKHTKLKKYCMIIHDEYHYVKISEEYRRIVMKNRFKVKYLSLLIVFLFVFVLPGCTSDIQSTNTNIPNEKENVVVSGNLKVHFIDVGQADSILIEQDSKYMLIDAGNNADGKLVKNYLIEQGVKTLEYVIGTHPHEDHSATRF